MIYVVLTNNQSCLFCDKAEALKFSKSIKGTYVEFKNYTEYKSEIRCLDDSIKTNNEKSNDTDIDTFVSNNISNNDSNLFYPVITYSKQIHIFNNWSEVKEYQKLNKGKEIKPSRVKKFDSRDKALAWASMMADYGYEAIDVFNKFGDNELVQKVFDGLLSKDEYKKYLEKHKDELDQVKEKKKNKQKKKIYVVINEDKSVNYFKSWKETQKYQKSHHGTEMKGFETMEDAKAFAKEMVDWKYDAIRKAKARNDYSAVAMLWSDGAVENK